MKTIAIIGIGKWGKNLIAEFSQYFKIKYCYSKGDKSNIRWIKKNYTDLEKSIDVIYIINKNIK